MQNTLDHTGKVLRRRQRRKQNNKIIVHHTFESGPLLNLEPPYRQLWKQSYVSTGTCIGKSRLIIGTMNNPCLQTSFVWKKPPREMFTRMKREE